MNETRRRRLRDRSSGTATLISEGCRVTGVLTGSCDFQVNGEVEGDCEIDSTLMLAKGDIFATGSVEITDTARITGTVSAEAIAVAEGAVVDGVMKTSSQSQPTEFIEKRDSDS
jgi:cytoskeletal protein CcmA (bactofilin family)